MDAAPLKTAFPLTDKIGVAIEAGVKLAKFKLVTLIVFALITLAKEVHA